MLRFPDLASLWGVVAPFARRISVKPRELVRSPPKHMMERVVDRHIFPPNFVTYSIRLTETALVEYLKRRPTLYDQLETVPDQSKLWRSRHNRFTADLGETAGTATRTILIEA